MLSSFLAKFSYTIMERILLEKEILLWKLLLLLLRQYGLLSVISIFAYGKIPKEGTFTGPLLFFLHARFSRTIMERTKNF